MKKVLLACMLVLGTILPAYAVTVSIDSSIQVSNAPMNIGSKFHVECGANTGVYTLSKDFSTNGSAGVMIVPISAIFETGGNWFCRTSFVQPYGQGPYSTEIPVTITVPSLSAPSLTVIP